MRVGKPTEGCHVELSVEVRLANGRRWSSSWLANFCLSYCLHSALKWAKEDMAREKVRGRSKIDGVKIEASEEEGTYREIIAAQEEAAADA